MKQPAPALRDAALALTRAASHKDAIAQLSHMTQALDGKATGAAAKEVEWSRLAGTSAMMAAMKERSEAIRRGLRRPRDPDADSRHALAIALMALVVHSEAHFVEDPIDKPVWQEACLELQGHMSRAAAAIKSRHESAADHFRMGMEVCARCHEKFKP